MFAQKLRELLYKGDKKINISQIAKEIGVSRDYFYKLLSGKSKTPTGTTIVKLANYFGVSVDYLLEDDADESKFTANNNIQSTITQIDNSNANIIQTPPSQSEELQELIKIYNSLPVKQRIQLLQKAYELHESN